jgi:hypothetical protein
VKMVTKLMGVYPISVTFRFTPRDSAYITAMMFTGLTFGTISSLFGLTHHIITQAQYTMLVTVVILSAVVPTLMGQAFFRPPLLLETRGSGLVSQAEHKASGASRRVPSGRAPKRALPDTEA